MSNTEQPTPAAMRLAEASLDAATPDGSSYVERPLMDAAKAIDAASVRQTVEALEKGMDIIDTIENRAMAADGPVTPNAQEATADEIEAVFKALYHAHFALNNGSLER